MLDSFQVFSVSEFVRDDDRFANRVRVTWKAGVLTFKNKPVAIIQCAEKPIELLAGLICSRDLFAMEEVR